MAMVTTMHTRLCPFRDILPPLLAQKLSPRQHWPAAVPEERLWKQPPTPEYARTQKILWPAHDRQGEYAGIGACIRIGRKSDGDRGRDRELPHTRIRGGIEKRYGSRCRIGCGDGHWIRNGIGGVGAARSSDTGICHPSEGRSAGRELVHRGTAGEGGRRDGQVPATARASCINERKRQSVGDRLIGAIEGRTHRWCRGVRFCQSTGVDSGCACGGVSKSDYKTMQSQSQYKYKTKAEADGTILESKH